MKTAIVINGLPRVYKSTCEAFGEMLNGADADVYIFAWDSDVNQLADHYNATRVETEPYEDYRQGILDKCPLIRECSNLKFGFSIETGLFAQYLSLQKAFNLIPDPDQYDLIMRVRFDWKPRFKIDWPSMNLDDDVISSPIQKMPGLKNSVFRMNDLFVCGKPSAFKFYANFNDHILDEELRDFMKAHNCIVPEFMLSKHLMDNGLRIEPRYWPYDLFNRGAKWRTYP